MSRIGILGGTFDPVHKGHLLLARDAIKHAGLDEVWFMPAKVQPFKMHKTVSDKHHRIAMLKAAISGDERLRVSTVEMHLAGPSYTYRTLRHVRKQLDIEDQLFFITGTDTYIKMDTWKHASELLSENAFIVGNRPGYRTRELHESREEYKRIYGTRTIVIDNEPVDISSTEIKQMIFDGKDTSEFLPEGVIEYINGHKLYR